MDSTSEGFSGIYEYVGLYRKHYECGCVLYKKDGIADIRQDFKETFEKCIAVDKDYYETIPLWQRAAGRLLRIFGPIL